MRIGELAASAGISRDTLRYYERAGLLPAPLRDAAGHRIYQRRDVEWLQFLMRLRATGMPISAMRRYGALRAEGEATLATRRTLLAAHRDRVRARMADMAHSLAALDRKIAHYDRMKGQADDSD